jgi:hypothetical protein
MNAKPALRWLLAALIAAPAALALAQQAPAPSEHPQSKEQPAAAAPAGPAEVIPVPLPQGTRLCLKDGNYLLVREYKVQNGRVSYWSVERGAWEEIPVELVDWNATHRGEAEDVERRKQIDKKLEEIKEHERAVSLTVDTSIEVAPGVFLPDAPGFYIVANGAVASLTQDLADSHLNMKQLFVKVITPIPVVPTKRDVKLKGEHAKLRIRDPQPEFYFRTADQREPALVLVRAHIHGGARQVTAINTNVVGQSSSKETRIAISDWVVAQGAFRYTLGQKLEPGEYAFVESVPEQGLDLYLWDFGVDAPGNTPPKK